MRALAAGASYFALMFGAGFILGTIRVFALEPALGLLAAALVELPVILAISYVSAGFIVRRFGLKGQSGTSLLAGSIAVAFLLCAEYLLGSTVRGMSPADFIANWARLEGALGLAAQIAAAFFPYLFGRRP